MGPSALHAGNSSRRLDAGGSGGIAGRQGNGFAPIGLLEASLGAKLFERRSDGCVLTKAGQEIIGSRDRNGDHSLGGTRAGR